MKFLKKSIAFILGFTMLCPLVACGGGYYNSSSSDSSTSSDGSTSSDDSTSSDSSTSSEDSSYTPEVKEQITEQVLQSITQQVSEAKTITLSASATLNTQSEIWEEQDSRGGVKQEEYSTNHSIELTAILSRTSKDAYNAKVQATYKRAWGGQSNFITDTAEIYLIDGYVFLSQDGTSFEKSPLLPDYTIDTIEEVVLVVEEALNIVVEDVQLPTVNTDVLFSALTDLATETFSFNATSMSLGYDFAPAITAMKDYLCDINPKQTIEQTLNNTLGLIHEALTVEAILDEVQSLANVNARTALTEIDAWLTEEYQTTLQRIWDTVTASQKFIDLFTYFATQKGAPSNEITEYLTRVQNFDIETTLSHVEGFENMTLYDVLVSAIYAPSAECATVEEVRDLVDSYLDTRLEDILPPVVFEAVEGIDVKELRAETSVGFDSSYTLTNFSNEFVCDGSITLPSMYDGLKDWVSLSASLKQTYTLSSIAFPIALPKGATIKNP